MRFVREVIAAVGFLPPAKQSYFRVQLPDFFAQSQLECILVQILNSEGSDMQMEVSLPRAFSVHQENEFFPIQHLMARLNPKLMVVQVATGKHEQGGCTVFWGLTYLDGHRVTKQDVGKALAEAGFDFARGSIQNLHFCDEPASTNR